MLQQEICPDCENLIPIERMDEDIIVCSCGYTRSNTQIKFDERKCSPVPVGVGKSTGQLSH